ncbi:calcium proton exchanger [Ceraceosorus bombacis]|uniref:Vacuolar calcium ion transporter n=1 Tax=Ceraceosorus bombacis TaxID=401625 RepID=A0A0P1B8Z6_9BASI|nr:calcium proton exchanger [Ceraceosorus bombacis]
MASPKQPESILRRDSTSEVGSTRAGLIQRPSKKTTLALESQEGSSTSSNEASGEKGAGGDSSLDRLGSGSTGAAGIASGAVGDASGIGGNSTGAARRSSTAANSSRRNLTKGESESRLGLGGNGPPRRMTMTSERQLLGRTLTSLLTPERPLAAAPTHYRSFINIIKYNPLNILLLCIPVSWALHFALDQTQKTPQLVTFIMSFLAIMPLAALLSYGTEEVALRVGETLGGLLNATLGNAVELIVAILALIQCQLVITQTSLIGSILSNLLLVLGMCFFVGGIRFKEQEFQQTAAQLNSSILAMAVIAVLIPAGFHATLGIDVTDDLERSELLKVSRGVSIILLFIYAGYLYFQLRSHTHLYASEAEEEEEVTLSLPMAVGLLVVSTVLVGVTSEWLVDAIDGFSDNFGVPKTWIGLVLLPIVSNAAEHATAVTASYKNKIDLAMGVAVGSSIQIAMFVIPLLVVIAWGLDKPLSLLFDPFVAILLFLAVLITNYAIADGRSNYMEGWLLMNTFIIIALVAWFIPDGGSLFSDDYCRTGVP